MRLAFLIFGMLLVFAVPVNTHSTDVDRPTIPINGLFPQGKTEVRIMGVEKQSFVVATRDGSLYEIPTSSILAYRQRNGRIEVKLSNGVVLVVLTEAGDSTDTDWNVTRRKKVGVSPSKRSVGEVASSPNQADTARKYRGIAADAQQLLNTARPAMETHTDASDVRSVAFRLRDLNKAIETGRWSAAATHVAQMQVSLERVRRIAQAAPGRLAQRKKKSAERERTVDRLRIEIDVLSHQISMIGSLSYENQAQRRLHQQKAKHLRQQRERLRRDLRKLEQEEKKETEFYEGLEQRSRL